MKGIDWICDERSEERSEERGVEERSDELEYLYLCLAMSREREARLTCSSLRTVLSSSSSLEPMFQSCCVSVKEGGVSVLLEGAVVGGLQ